MELRNLITFINVAELGSFTKAAQLLGYSQSTISFQIKQLEDELGCLLFERINHTITLTERGRELVSYAHQIRTLTDEFKESFEEEKECNGHIHIVTPDSVCDEMIKKSYMDFHNKYPAISVKFTTADTSVMFDMLDHNEADVIITLDSHSYHKDYVIAKEQPLSMHFVANAGSKFAGARNLSIHDIINEPFILTEYGQGYRRVFDKELAKKSLEITPILEIGRTDMITSLITQGDMLSFLPDFVTRDMIEAGNLCYLDICDMNIDIWKQLIHHKNKWMSKSLKIFIEYTKENEFSSFS
ncbi:MAG: LysR family transcriptional regulator [Oscillospiraceae bacterium]|nr:LysR family transcriptional regulator [Oscillospiraceae bacterium]MBQ3225368.1 LysR family transcriptional regulator [Oscillospiraceae bacterium]MBQ6699008.1 LysR family transcriptional regulator [Oscillospiraceae bacterium]